MDPIFKNKSDKIIFSIGTPLHPIPLDARRHSASFPKSQNGYLWHMGLNLSYIVRTGYFFILTISKKNTNGPLEIFFQIWTQCDTPDVNLEALTLIQVISPNSNLNLSNFSKYSKCHL
jgi:hypothetical protein